MNPRIVEAHAHMVYALDRLGKVPPDELPASVVSAAVRLRDELYELIPPGPAPGPVILKFPQGGRA